MAHGILTGSGERVFLTVPTRYHAYTRGGSKYSLSAAADFLADAGFDGVDLSLDQLESDDDGARSVLYSFGNRAAARGLTIPMCHLPFYMPNPDDGAAMTRFSREIACGIRAAAMLKISDAVAKCWYYLYSTNSISGGFRIDGGANTPSAAVNAAEDGELTFKVPASGESMFWKVLARPELEPLE
jgi:hypothetical protein